MMRKVPRRERHLHEECGVFGLFSPETADVASLAYYGLFALQHRGQESAGIAVNDDGVFSVWPNPAMYERSQFMKYFSNRD